MELARAGCNRTLGIGDVPVIVNGRPDDPLDHKPFAKYAAHPETLEWARTRVGIWPFNRRSLDPKYNPVIRMSASDEASGRTTMARLISSLEVQREELQSNLVSTSFF